MKFYLVRHPKTKRNENKKLTGWEKTIYSKSGREQFNQIVNFFKKKKLEIYSSDLPRALCLAKAISKQTKTKLHISKLLREKNFRETKPLNKYETEKQFEKRVLYFFNKIWGKEGIILTHAGVVRVIINKLADKKMVRKFLKTSREKSLLIETNKKGINLKIIRLK